jgi:hypothetical protein
MSFLDAPVWLQVVIAAESLALAWLTYRFGSAGLLAGFLAAGASWFVVAFGASWLVGRLEGAGPLGARDLIVGSALATLRLAEAAGLVLALGVVVGAAARRLKSSPRAQRRGRG